MVFGIESLPVRNLLSAVCFAQCFREQPSVVPPFLVCKVALQAVAQNGQGVPIDFTMNAPWVLNEKLDVTIDFGCAERTDALPRHSSNDGRKAALCRKVPVSASGGRKD